MNLFLHGQDSAAFASIYLRVWTVDYRVARELIADEWQWRSRGMGVLQSLVGFESHTSFIFIEVLGMMTLFEFKFL